jgi:TonB family protein
VKIAHHRIKFSIYVTEQLFHKIEYFICLTSLPWRFRNFKISISGCIFRYCAPTMHRSSVSILFFVCFAAIAQAQECNSLISFSINSIGDSTWSFTKAMNLTKNGEGLFIHGILSAETFAMVFTAHGAGNCVDSAAAVQFIFDDDTMISEDNHFSTNCEKRSVLYFSEAKGNLYKFQLLRSKRLRSIRVATEEDIVTQQIDSLAGTRLGALLNCISDKFADHVGLFQTPVPVDSYVGFIVVEHQPEFPGGTDAMMDFVKKNLKIPKRAANGTVYVQFIVEKNGSLSEVSVLRGISQPFNEAAVNLVRKMPKWVPAMQNGQPVRIRFVLPIRFRSGL